MYCTYRYLSLNKIRQTDFIDIGHHGVVFIEIKDVGKCKFCCLYIYIYHINKSTKERHMFSLDSSRLIVFWPSSTCTCGSEAKCKPQCFRNVAVSFQLFLTQENDSDIDFDIEDFDSDEESDSELV